MRTRPSSEPSIRNPTYSDILELPLDLPTDPIFLPNINLRVVDNLLGGAKR